MTTDAVPADYRILVPESWFCVPLEPDERDRAIKSLADRQFARLGTSTPALKLQLREQLRRHAEAAWQSGGIELYLSQMRTGPGNRPRLPADHTGPTAPGRGPVPPGSLASVLAARAENTGATITELRLRPGPALRVVRQSPVTGLNMDVHIQVPGSGAWLLLAFATPLTDVATQMRGLFDTIAGSLRWSR
jgi:hypothetical protein